MGFEPKTFCPTVQHTNYYITGAGKRKCCVLQAVGIAVNKLTTTVFFQGWPADDNQAKGYAVNQVLQLEENVPAGNKSNGNRPVFLYENGDLTVTC